MLTYKDIVQFTLSREDLTYCIGTAKNVLENIIDRQDLHIRDDLERFINILMGEVAETMVLQWLRSNGKRAYSASDKKSEGPDAGHDLIIMDTQDRDLKCSVKSSLSYKLDVGGILEICRLATKPSELRDINVQVYFWLTLNPTKNSPRITVPSIRQSSIIGWFGKNDITKFSTYNHEQRQVPAVPLKNARTMSELLKYLK